jgi:hypothetical protein
MFMVGEGTYLKMMRGVIISENNLPFAVHVLKTVFIDRNGGLGY